MRSRVRRTHAALAMIIPLQRGVGGREADASLVDAKIRGCSSWQVS